MAQAEAPPRSSEDADFIRLLVCDLHGIARSKTVTSAAYPGLKKSGPGMFSGTLALMFDNGIVPDLPGIADRGYPDLKAKPADDDAGQIPRPLPWAGGDKFKVAAVICEPIWANGLLPQEASPRYAARRLCDKLQLAHNLKIWHASEMEFVMFNQDRTPAFGDDTFFVSQAFAQWEEEFFSVTHMLQQAGVPVQTLQTEYGKGQVEIVLDPTFGIEGADNEFIFRNGIKEMLQKPGHEHRATFMAKPIEDGIGSSGHFNHSLWNAETGADAMWDDQSSTKLSATAEHWLAGILEHAEALSALCCPTVNCWRRLHQAFTPYHSSWGVEMRTCMVRVKTEGPGKTYFEQRLGSAAQNPYLALAGIVAAGIDGIEKKLPLKKEGPNEEMLPSTLPDALDALERDSVLGEQLGSELVQWFVATKRFEIKTLEDKVKASSSSDFDAEFDYYSKWL